MQDVRQKVFSKTRLGLVLVTASLGTLSVLALASILRQQSQEYPYLAAGTHQPGVYLVKVKPGKNVERIRTVIPKQQKVYRHKSTKQTLSPGQWQRASNRGEYKTENIPVAIDTIEPIFPGVVSEFAKKKIAKRNIDVDLATAGTDVGLDRWYQVRMKSKEVDVADLVERMKRLPGDVETASPNGVSESFSCASPDDPYSCSTGAWGQGYLDQWNLDASNIRTALQYSYGDSGVIIAVPDSGVDYRNSEFQGKIWLNVAEDINHNNCADYQDTADLTPFTDCHGNIVLTGGDLNYQDDDLNGYRDDINGMDFVHESETIYDSTAYDWNDSDGPADGGSAGHGTFVAGIASAATNNSQSLAAACGGCMIMPSRNSFGIGWGSDVQRAMSVIYAADNGADVINMSWGAAHNAVVDNALVYAHQLGATLVAAAGNANPFTNEKQSLDGRYPADHPYVISVGSITHENAVSLWSSYGNALDLVAPGEDVLSVRARDILTRDPYPNQANPVNDDVTRGTGTSFAAPHVSGIIGLMLSANPTLTPEEIELILTTTATPVHSVIDESGTTRVFEENWNPYAGYGVVNAQLAVEQAKSPRYQLELYFTKSAATRRSTQDTVRVSGTVNNQNGRTVRNLKVRAYNNQGTAGQILGEVILEPFSLSADFVIEFPPSNSSIVTVALDPDNDIPETYEDNNIRSSWITSNVAPTIQPIPVQNVDEGGVLRLTPTTYDFNDDVLAYTLQPADPRVTFSTRDGSILFKAGYFDAGTLNFTLGVTDGDLGDVEPITITVRDVVPPPFVTLVAANGLAAAVDHGILIAEIGAPDGCWERFGSDSTFTQEDRRCENASVFPGYYLKWQNLQLQDVQYLRLRMNTGGKWHPNIPAEGQLTDEGIYVRREPVGSGWEFSFDLPALAGQDADYIDSYEGYAYAASMRFVERDAVGRSYGTAGFTGWPRSWRDWRTECHDKATGSEDKNGLGARFWSNGTSPTSVLTYLTLCVIDDSNGDIHPEFMVEAHLKSLNQAPVFTTLPSSKTVTRFTPLNLKPTATDFNQDRLQYTVLNKPIGATVNPNTGELTWTPGSTQTGTFTFGWAANDGLVTTTSDPVTITVVNNPPVASTPKPLYYGAWGQAMTIPVSVSDPDGDPLFWSIRAVTTGAPAVQINKASSTLTIPYPNKSGDSQYLFTVADGQRTASVDIIITIPSTTGGGGGGGDDINKNTSVREPTRQE